MEENNQLTDEEKEKPPETATLDSNDSAAEEKATVEEPALPKEPEKPDLAADLAELESMDLRKAIIIKFKGGRHPNAHTDELLVRYFNFSSHDFQGPYVVRLVCTILMIFTICAILWGILWVVASSFGLTYFTRLLSTGMATLLAAVAGIAIFHPASIPNENELNQIIAKRLSELHEQLSSQPSDEDKSEETKAPSDLVDADYDALKDTGQPQTPDNLETSLPNDEMIEPVESKIKDEETNQDTATKNP